MTTNDRYARQRLFAPFGGEAQARSRRRVTLVGAARSAPTAPSAWCGRGSAG
jgi:hypothetical protein